MVVIWKKIINYAIKLLKIIVPIISNGYPIPIQNLIDTDMNISFYLQVW
jgi:hypothetical protein